MEFELPRKLDLSARASGEWLVPYKGHLAVVGR